MRARACEVIGAASLVLGSLAPGCQAHAHAESLLPGAEVHIVVHADRPTVADIPATIFSAFLEPIERATYGGLWAELLENGSFEDGLWSASESMHMERSRPELVAASQLGLPLPWKPLFMNQGSRYEPRWGDAANASRSLEVMALPDREVGVRQRIYLPTQRTLDYVGSIWVKHLAGPAEISVSIRRSDGEEPALAETSFSAESGDWRRYTFRLSLQKGQVARLEPLSFAISLQHDARALIDQVSLLPSDNVDGMDPDVVELAKGMKPALIRFGGNFTSGYHWLDGVGPRDKRVPMINLAWGIPEYNAFGTDEFLDFCRLVHAQPQIALNLGSGTPQEAADWVKYVDDHWGDHQGGLLWELGNELWGDYNTGYPTQQEIGQRTEIFSKAVRGVDPAARLIATGADPDHFRSWNAEQLRTPVGTFNYLSTHMVVTTDEVQLPRASNDFIARASFAIPVEMGRRFQSMRSQIESAKRPDVKLALTEWLFMGEHESDGRSAPDFSNMGGAIIAGGLLNTLMDHADVVPIADMTGIVEFAGIKKRREQVFAAPAYWVFRTYAEAAPRRLLTVESDGPTYKVSRGVTRLPEITDVPELDVRAALLEGGDLAVFCINRSLVHDYRTAITIRGFQPAQRMTTEVIASPSIYDVNDEADPEAIGVMSGDGAAAENTTYTFRHASVTVLRFHPAKSR